ncbi:hypothetical protein [Vibrio mediterranei]|uniref:hypothetical protein n=1 Tax=Vibrio mediterranei TaxID=689 RepID=UPI00406829A8
MEIHQKVKVRPLTKDEISRFETCEKQEKKIAKSYGTYSEFDLIREGQWIMRTGPFIRAAL